MPRIATFALAAVLMVTLASQALACACCASTGERMDLAMPLNAGHVEELQRLRFEKAAQLFLGEADPDSVKGIATPSARYDLDAAWRDNQFVFAFRDDKGRAGTLALQRPATIGIFHTDLRQEPEGGLGPALYKEWRLTAKANGAGVFAPGLGAQQLLTLVLQGRGNNCSGAGDFTHWMLVMRGPKAKYHLFGDLAAEGKP